MGTRIWAIAASLVLTVLLTSPASAGDQSAIYNTIPKALPGAARGG